jgi:hypothetical protein
MKDTPLTSCTVRAGSTLIENDFPDAVLTLTETSDIVHVSILKGPSYSTRVKLKLIRFTVPSSRIIFGRLFFGVNKIQTVN